MKERKEIEKLVQYLNEEQKEQIAHDVLWAKSKDTYDSLAPFKRYIWENIFTQDEIEEYTLSFFNAYV